MPLPRTPRESPAYGQFRLKQPVHVTRTAFFLFVGEEDGDAPVVHAPPYSSAHHHLGTLCVRRPCAQVALLQRDGLVPTTWKPLPDRLAVYVWFSQILAPVGCSVKGGLRQVKAEAEAKGGRRDAAFGGHGRFGGPLLRVVFRTVGQLFKGFFIDFNELQRGEHAEQVAVADALLRDDLLLAAGWTQQVATDQIFEFLAERRSGHMLSSSFPMYRRTGTWSSILRIDRSTLVR